MMFCIFCRVIVVDIPCDSIGLGYSSGITYLIAHDGYSLIVLPTVVYLYPSWSAFDSCYNSGIILIYSVHDIYLFNQIFYFG